MAADDEAPLPLEGQDEDLEPLPLEDEASSAGGESKIHAFGSVVAAGAVQRELSRTMNLPGTGATRCRVFNSKITVGAIDHMVDQINEWLDSSEVEVKHVTQVVGVVEGKKAESNVILTVWY